jgi:carbamoyltransferase
VHCIRGGPRRTALTNVYLGREWDRSDVRATLKAETIEGWKEYQDEPALIDAVSELLADGAVIGWFQGRFEWGPRALGARSILADPTRADIQRIVNEKIKFREPFRPFAPAVLAERAHEFFDVPEVFSQSAPENFMLSVASVRPEKRAMIPAVTHADGTARLQLVRAATAPRFAKLLAQFEKRKGVPILLNTSFNLRGEPMVASPLDALRTFSWSGMDYLVLGDIVVGKDVLRCA